MASSQLPSDSLESVCIAPYVAAMIIEHAKRRVIAAGYLVGQRTTDAIRVTNFFPCTHDHESDVNERSFSAKVSQRKDVLASFSDHFMIGWYSACCTKNAAGEENSDYVSWCKAPAALFAGTKNSSRHALHVHCEMPLLEEEGARPAIDWKATLFQIKRVSTPEGQAVVAHPITQSLKVQINAGGHEATNVVLGHVRNSVLFGNEKPHPTPMLMNLDSILLQQQQSSNKSHHDEVIELRKRLEELISGGKHEALVEGIRQFRPSLDDRFKDALMVKCLALLLKRSVAQIDLLSSQYPDAAAAGAPRAGGSHQAGFRSNFNVHSR